MHRVCLAAEVKEVMIVYTFTLIQPGNQEILEVIRTCWVVKLVYGFGV